MNKILSVLKDYDIRVDKVRFWKDSWIVSSKNKKYLLKLKKKSKESIFSYLNSLSYPYYMPLFNSYHDSYELYPYYDDQETDVFLKAKEVVTALGLLHNKTCYDEEMKEEEKEIFYQEQVKKIEDAFQYYLSLQDSIDEVDFPTPDAYLLLCHISTIYQSLKLSRYYLDKWYFLMNGKIRKALLIQNLSLTNFRISDCSYFIDFDEVREDIVVFDFVSFYKKECLNVDMRELFSAYQDIFPFTLDEKYLFFSHISLPDKISFGNSKYENTILVKRVLDTTIKVLSFLSEEDEENQETNEDVFQ